MSIILVEILSRTVSRQGLPLRSVLKSGVPDNNIILTL